MKFLVDAMLPLSLSDYLTSKGYDSVHTSQLPLKNKTTDSTIIKISDTEKRIVITKDSDFGISKLINHLPYKLILITTGNIKNSDLLKLIDKNFNFIVQNLENSEFIELNEMGLIRNF